MLIVGYIVAYPAASRAIWRDCVPLQGILYAYRTRISQGKPCRQGLSCTCGENNKKCALYNTKIAPIALKRRGVG